MQRSVIGPIANSLSTTWGKWLGRLFVAVLFGGGSLWGCGGLTQVEARDWPTFRGADRTGVSTETGLLQSWPAGGPKLVWQAEGTGRGYSSLAVVGNRIYTLGDNLPDVGSDDEYLLCLDAANGKQVWKTKTGAPWNSGPPQWQSSRSTPTVEGDTLCCLTPQGELFCCNVSDGKVRWHKSFPKDFGGKKGDGWGYSESVLIDGDKVICTPGGTSTTMVALDRRTGETKWKMVRAGDRGAGHASIARSTIRGVSIYVQTTASGPLGVRASDGKLLWEYPIERTTAVIPSPIVRDNLVFFTAGYKRGGALLKQVPHGTGEVKIEEVYGLKKDLANKHGGIVLVGDYLYGDSEDQGIPFCAHLLTGEVKWKKRGTGRNSAAIAATDSRLYIHFADGTAVLAKADPAEYVETGSFKVPGSGDRPSWCHPAIANGKLYLRENNTLLCYDVSAK